MKIHIDNDAKTIALEGKQSVQQVFNLLMAWFPEDWERWSFVPFEPAIVTKEVVVEKEIWKNPYWGPFTPYYYGLGDTNDRIPNIYCTSDSHVTLNLT